MTVCFFSDIQLHGGSRELNFNQDSSLLSKYNKSKDK